HAVGGTGIAAPQVGVVKRLVIYFAKQGRGVYPLEEDLPITVMINPQIRPGNDEVFYDWEGCLSVPGLTGLVPRYRDISITYTNLEGQEISHKASGFHARLLQHECDHLDGILYPQRMDDMSLLIFADQLAHGVPEKAREILISQEEKK
ncbi:MAG: peptide deformylase, partial [Alphaproteobacteria bacterium]|nr:peptide deformylase [Alphaproteobacteria bacterium]